MGLDIVTNSMAEQASNDLSTNQSNMQSSLEKLSSGYQINTAADDASGLVISQHLQAQIGGFQQAQSNTQAGINVVQTASGALSEVSTILQRINTLAVESQNSSATDSTAQQAAQSEVNQALSSITDIAATTVYGDNQLLTNGTNATVNYTFQTGYDGSSASQVAFSVTALNLANLGLVNGTLTDGTSGVIGTGGSSGIQSVVGNVAAGQYALQATAAISGSQTGVAGNTFATGTFTMAGTGETFNISVDGGTAVTVTLGTTETAADIGDKINTALTAAGQTSSVAVSASTGGILTIASNTYGAAGSIGITAGTQTATDLGFSTLTTTAGADAVLGFGTSSALSTVALTQAQDQNGSNLSFNFGTSSSVVVALNGPLVTTAAQTLTQATFGASTMNEVNYSVTASNAISVVQNAIATVSSMEGQFGAYQNQLQDISDNETVGIQNLTSSNANIMDTNMASQMVNFTQDQVLVQAGVSMLAQANQIPQYVLKLLG
jgi:flagellin